MPCRPDHGWLHRIWGQTLNPCFSHALAPRTDRATDLVERPALLLKVPYLQQPFEMIGAVVPAAANTERRREQSFLNVVADRPPRDAAEVSELGDSVARFLPAGHTEIVTV